MCYTHGKLIDTDEVRFTPEMLLEWKRINETITKIRQETGYGYKTAYESLSLDKFIENEISLPKYFAINKIVENAIHDSCLAISWGKRITDTIRDFLIEHIRNAYTHGGADSCTLKISHKEVIVMDDGIAFDPRQLYRQRTYQGGSKSIQYLLDNHGSDVFISAQTENGKNSLTISVPDTADFILESTSCAVDISMESLHQGNISYQLKETCRELFFILPEYFALSDIAFIKHKHPVLANETRHLIFVLRYSSDHVKELLEQQFPNAQILTIQNS